MNLAFYGGGDHLDNLDLDKELIKFLGRKKKPQVTYIPSSGYLADIEFREFTKHYSRFKITNFLTLNIDEYFSPVLQRAVLQSDIIYLGGGNTYHFLYWLRKTKFLNLLKAWVHSGGVLVGLSAGAIIMGPNINTAGMPDFDRDENEDNLKNLKSMGLVDFEFFPHYKNSKRYDEVLLKYSRKITTPIYASKDGSGIIVSTNQINFIGHNYAFIKGKKVTLSK